MTHLPVKRPQIQREYRLSFAPEEISEPLSVKASKGEKQVSKASTAAFYQTRKSNSNPPPIFGPLFHPYESLSSYFSLLFHNELQQTSHTNSYISNSLILYSYKVTTMSIISNYHFIFAWFISNGYIWNYNI